MLTRGPTKAGGTCLIVFEIVALMRDAKGKIKILKIGSFRNIVFALLKYA